MKRNLFEFGKVIIAMVVVIVGFWFATPEGSEVHAANNTETYTDSATVKEYLENDTAPVSKENPDWLFAGWFTDAECTEPAATAVEGTTYYAKFVDPDVLSVKVQVKADAFAEETTETNMRLVTSVDSLNYSNVGFEVYYGEAGTAGELASDVESHTVYERIQANNTSGVAYNYSPKVIDVNSEYFMTATLIGIQKANYGKAFYIKPYWTTLDGTKVYGTSRYVTIGEDAMSTTTINVPVKVSNAPETTEDIAVTYGDSKSATADLVYYEAPYAHLRISVTDLPSLTEFTITDGGAVASTFYRNLNTVYTGKGTEDVTWCDYDNEDEFVIATSADFYGFASYVKSYAGKTIYLCSDIVVNTADLIPSSETYAEDGSWDTAAASFITWTPNTNSFNGTFDGQGHTISGIYLNQTNAVNNMGLFGIAETASTIKNLSLKNSYIYSVGQNVGSIVGRGRGNLYNIYSDAIVIGTNMNIGGLIGQINACDNSKYISNCWFDGSVTMNGVAGSCYRGGGIVGCLLSGYTELTLEHCLFSGTITNTAAYSSSISANTQGMTGGLVGYVDGGTLNVDDSMSTGLVSVVSVYYTGIGIGYSNNVATSFENAYAMENSDKNLNDNGFGRCSVTSGSDGAFDYLSKGSINGYAAKTLALDYVEEAVDSTPDYWIMRDGDTPALKSFVATGLYRVDTTWPSKGTGTEADPYLIEDADDLSAFMMLAAETEYVDKHYQLTADIEINSKGVSGTADSWGTYAPQYEWLPIAVSAGFQGSLDGQMHTISGIYINADAACAGLFGKTTATAVVEKIILEHSYITSAYDHVGSISGRGGGTFDTIYSDVIIDATGSNIGGIFGQVNAGPTSLANCWFDGTINISGSGIQAGGIVGAQALGTMTIKYCLNAGDLTSTNSTTAVSSSGACVGGICGLSTNDSVITIKNSLNTGKITSVNKTNVGGVLGGCKGGTTVTIQATYDKSGDDTFGVYGGMYSGNQNVSASAVTEELLTGSNAFDNTYLDYMKYWVAKESGTPELTSFTSDEGNETYTEIRPYTGWYQAEGTTFTISTASELWGMATLAAGGTTFEGQTIYLDEDILVNSGTNSDWLTAAPQFAWTPISGFKGTFDGQMHTISGIYGTGTTKVGLFGSTAAPATIQNLKLENSCFVASSWAGSIVGQGTGTLNGIYSDACVKVTGGYSGGLVGDTRDGSLSIANSWFAGTVESTQTSSAAACGGFVGQSLRGNVVITNGLYTGAVYATQTGSAARIGGFVGLADGSSTLDISECLSVGSVESKFVNTMGSVTGQIGSGTTLNLTDVYYAQNKCKYGANTVTRAAGLMNGALGGTMTENGVVQDVAETSIVGSGAETVLLNLDFEDTWVITEGMPTLQIFTE